MSWEAGLHDKKINVPNSKVPEQESEMSADEQQALDNALQAAMLRKRMESERQARLLKNG